MDKKVKLRSEKCDPRSQPYVSSLRPNVSQLQRLSLEASCGEVDLPIAHLTQSQCAVSACSARSLCRDPQALLSGDVYIYLLPSPITSIWRPPYWGAHGWVIFQAPLQRPPSRLGGRGPLKTLAFTRTQYSVFSLLLFPKLSPMPSCPPQTGRSILSGASCLCWPCSRGKK